MPKKRIIFTGHSLDRISGRGLSEEWVVDIINNPTEVWPLNPDNTQEFRQKRSGSWYYAVVEHKTSVIVVITCGEAGKK